MIRLVLIFSYIALLTDVDCITTRSKQQTITFHRYYTSWNQAQEICVILGDNLYVEDSEEKAIVLATYRSQNNWANEEANHTWIGLHSVRTGVSYTWVYGMPTCDTISSHSQWDAGEPIITNRCGTQHLTNNKWISMNCQLTSLTFICETDGSSDCTFTTSNGIPKPNLQYETQTKWSIRSVCRKSCLDSVYNNMNCWAATYEPFTCVLYYTVDPWLFSNRTTIEASTKTLYVKSCYTSAVDSTQDTATTAGISTTPEEGCSSVITSSPSPISSTVTTTATFTTTTTETTPSATTTLKTSTTSTPAQTATTTTATSTSTRPITTTTTETTITTKPSTTIKPTISTTLTKTTTLTTTITPESTTTSTRIASLTSTTIISSTSPSANCFCLCVALRSLYTNYSNSLFANMTIEEKLEAIIARLRVNKKGLSATIRKKTSAEDNRVASVSVGVLATVFIAVVFGFLAAADAVNFVTYLHKATQRKLNKWLISFN